MSVIDRTRRALRELGQKSGPILVGPWLSEVGFELLYWIPFLRWAVRFAGLSSEDIYIVSRGGCRSWYQGISSHYIDVLDFFSPDELRVGNEKRIAAQSTHAAQLGLRSGALSPKQHEVSDFDEVVMAAARVATGHPFTRRLHPSLMYAFFKPFWRRKAKDLYHTSAVVKRLQPPSVALDLPDSYVAMKFYASNALPYDANHQMVQELVWAQAKTSDVVLLHSGTRYDDHGDFPIAAHPRVHHVEMPPAQNLDIQTAVIARATLFVGTYGGFAYLAPFLGVPTLALYGKENFRKDHRDLMAHLASADLDVAFTIEPISGVRHVAKRARRRAA